MQRCLTNTAKQEKSEERSYRSKRLKNEKKKALFTNLSKIHFAIVSAGREIMKMSHSIYSDKIMNWASYMHFDYVFFSRTLAHESNSGVFMAEWNR